MISASAAALAAGPLAREGGALVVEVPAALVDLRADVASSARSAHRAWRPDPNDRRKGDPDRHLVSVDGGPVLEALYGSTALADLVGGLAGVRCAPLGPRASYSAYGPGDHLGVHRDIPGCDVTVIAVVDDTGDDRGRPHPLWTWPGRASEPLGDIRATPGDGRTEVRAHAGQAVVVLGSVVPHRLPPLPAGQRRVVAPLCFTLAG